jgi:hypothetical protein
MEWQPIETAPKDGSEILVKIDSEVVVAFYSPRPVCMLGPVHGGHPPGWATGRSNTTDYNLPLDTPTHWMTLPPPPEQTLKKAKGE